MKNQFWEKLAVVTVILSERAYKKGRDTWKECLKSLRTLLNICFQQYSSLWEGPMELLL